MQTLYMSSFKPLARMGNWMIVFMLILTVLFQNERMYFLDPNWMLYLLTLSENIYIQENRFGSFITHLFPVLGIKFGLSLSGIQFLYNVSFFAFFTSGYYFIYKYCKQYVFNLLLIGYFTIFVGDVFFWPSNEVHQGVVFALMGMALYFAQRNNPSIAWGHLFFIFLFLFLGITSHLLVAIPIIFIWLFLYIKPLLNKTILRQDIYLGLCILAIVIVKFIISKNGNYDASKLSFIDGLTINNITSSLISNNAKDFYGLLWNWHLPVLLTLIFTLWALWKLKNLPQLFILCFTILGTWIIINIIYPDHMPRNLWFYMESEYQIFGIILLLPITYCVMISGRMRTMFNIYIALVVLGCFVKISNGYSYFNQRYENLKMLITYCHDQKINKGILALSPLESQKYFIMDWGLPIESLTYSINHLGIPITIKVVPESNIDYLQNIDTSSNVFYNCFDTNMGPNIENKYFRLDPEGSYKIINKADIFNILKQLQ